MSPTPPRRGLVLGAGGALGGAWTVGALCALADVEGLDPRTVDILVGTSAGSVLAALIGCGHGVDELAQKLSIGPEHTEGTGPVNPFDVHAAMAAIPRPLPLPGNLLLAARAVGNPRRHTIMTAAAALAPRGRGTLRPVAELVADAEGGRGWPVLPHLWIPATDFDSGRRVVFGRQGSPVVALAEAVVASCAAPGFFPPVAIGDRRYVDGGAVSVTNADVLLAEELDEVLVLAPMAMRERDRPGDLYGRMERRMRTLWTRRLDGEVARLRDTGAQVRVVIPTQEDLVAMGSNVMDPRRRTQVLETSRRTSKEQLARNAVGP